MSETTQKEPTMRVRISHAHTCACGCGQTTRVANRSRPYMGHVKGEHIPFVNGHNRKRFDHTPDGFWARVDRSGGADACWPWLGARHDFGYGMVYWRGETVGAHRVAFEIGSGPISGDLWVLHGCDNPVCCNPAHLRLGTTQDNTAEREARGRTWRGTR